MSGKPKHSAPAVEPAPADKVPSEQTASEWESAGFHDEDFEAAYGCEGTSFVPVSARDNARKARRSKKGRRRTKAGAHRGVYNPYSESHGVASGGATRSVTAYRRKRNPIGVFFRFVGSVAAVVVLLAVVGAGILAVTDYRPRSIEDLDVQNQVEAPVKKGQQVSVLTWNIGYGGLSSPASSFVDGGAGVLAQSQDQVESALEGVEGILGEQAADIVLLQEVDRASDRSFLVDQEKSISDALQPIGYSSCFAQDFKVFYVPYPWPCLGKVDSGLLTESGFAVASAERVSFEEGGSRVRKAVGTDPCVLVQEIPVEGIGKKLVVMNVRFSDRVDESIQDAQEKELALLMKREADKGNYVIAGGDFDQNFSSADVRFWGKEISRVRSTGVLDEGIFPEGMQFAMDSSVATARSLNASLDDGDDEVRFYVSDGFIASSNLQVDSVETIDTGFRFSDHNPVKLVATLL